jgi:rod shape-determining protein MreD
MRVIIWFVVIFLALSIQATIIPLLSVHGVRPDLLLIIVVSVSLLWGKEYGVGIGFFAGLAQDLASGNIFGLNLLSKLAVGYVFGMAERKVFKEHLLLPIMATVLATLFSNAVALLVLTILNYKVDFLPAIYNILPVILYNMVLSVPVHKLIFRLSKSELITG